MDTALIVLVSVLVGAVAVAFYMDWLGLWVSKEEMREQIDSSKERLQGPGQQLGEKAPAIAATAREETGAVASGTRG